MVAEVRRLKFQEGVQVTAPISFAAATRALVSYVDDNSYEVYEGAPQTGSLYYNNTVGRIRIHDGISWSDFGDNQRSGIVSLVSGESSKTITFSSAWDDVNYVASIDIECDDSNPIFLSYVVKNKTVNGFTVLLNAPVDSNNYKINYKIGIQK